MEEILVFWSDSDYQKISVSGKPPLKCFISNKTNNGDIEEVEIEEIGVFNPRTKTVNHYYVIKKFSTHHITNVLDIYPAIEDVNLKPI
ncbi:hypothetical protein [Enterobacter hormaechei]